MYNKEAMRKLLEDIWNQAVTWYSQLGMGIQNDDKQTHITTRLAALDDGDDGRRAVKEFSLVLYRLMKSFNDIQRNEQQEKRWKEAEYIQQKNFSVNDILRVDDGQEGKELDGAALIATERQRQKEVEGWTSEHDNTHFNGELAKAAACYAVYHTDSKVVEHGENAWPWEDKWWKPSNDKIKNLVKAGALIAAEIDRIRPPKALPVADGEGEKVASVSLKIEFQDFWDFDDRIPESDRWLASLNSMPGMVVTAPTKDEAFNEIIVSLKVKAAYDSKYHLPSPPPCTTGGEG